VAATPSVKITKTIPFLGGTRQFTNRYHFNGGVPADHGHWTTLFNAIVAAEKLIYSNRVTIVEATAYNAGSDLPLFSDAYSTAGTYAPAAGTAPCPGDCAKVGVWLTTARSSKNHPVFLFSYWHGVYFSTSGSPDEIVAAQRTLYHNYMGAWVAGFSDGTNTYVRAGPNGATGYDYKAPVPEYITHRDFPR
jgi:hypothetical protein